MSTLGLIGTTLQAIFGLHKVYKNLSLFWPNQTSAQETEKEVIVNGWQVLCSFMDLTFAPHKKCIKFT